jgi:hypothetical protein
LHLVRRENGNKEGKKEQKEQKGQKDSLNGGAISKALFLPFFDFCSFCFRSSFFSDRLTEYQQPPVGKASYTSHPA